MYDEASLHRYGTSLPALEEDEVPSKKPIRPEDQIVTDENGKRRFHGAFTGGFSAGYWNTVGSQEGWTPSSFKSSRSEKATARSQQRPEDFMDAEDLGEFGIAPQRMQARAEYAYENDNSRKRKFEDYSQGPIPGLPVLAQLLKQRDEKIGERILKNMGWREGQGIGPRLTYKEKKAAQERHRREAYLLQQYSTGADRATPSASVAYSSSGEDDMEDEEITFAPDDYEPYTCQPKNDHYGLGYKEYLSKDPVLAQHFQGSGSKMTDKSGHINLFPPSLQVLDKHNRKMSIRGHAFGVGALEEEDEDIYAHEDMTRYDFSLEDKQPKQLKEKFVQERGILEGFCSARYPSVYTLRHKVEIPQDFKPRNWLERRSRFAPLDPRKAKELEKSLRQNDFPKKMTPEHRGTLLGESSKDMPMTSMQAVQAKQLEQRERAWQVEHAKEVVFARQLEHVKQMEQVGKIEREIQRGRDKTQELLAQLSQPDKFTRGSIILPDTLEEKEDLADKVRREQRELMHNAHNKTQTLIETLTNAGFKPFINDEAKQQRYEEFLAANVQSELDIAAFLNNIQPLHLSDFDREMEKKEFIQAKNIYKPLGGSMAERFVSASTLHAEPVVSIAEPEEEDRVFSIKRTKSTWKPAVLLCKRYNIAEPSSEANSEEDMRAPKAKLSVFDYLESSVNKKSDFQTPVIIPKNMERLQSVLRPSPTESNVWLMPSSLTEIEPKTSGELKPQASTSATTPGRHIAKTDLEKRIEDSLSKPAWEKLDIFQAIFDDDSEEESGEQSEAPVQVTVIAPCNTKAQSSQTSYKNAVAANLLRNTSPPRGIFKALLEEIKTVVPRIDEGKALTKSNDTPAAKAKATTQETKPTKSTKETAADEPMKIIFQSKRERLRGAGVETDVYGPKVPEHIKQTQSESNMAVVDDEVPTTSKHNKSDTNIVQKNLEDAIIDNKLQRLLDSHRTNNYMPTIDEEWVEKKVALDDTESDTSLSSSYSESSGKSCDRSVGEKRKRKLKKRYKKKKTKKGSKEGVEKSEKKSKKIKKKSKKHAKSHKSKKSKSSL